jgi:cell division septation protein DedD
MTSLMHSIQGRQHVRSGVLVVTQLAVVLALGGCSIWPKALTFSSAEPEPVAAAPAPTPAAAACTDCADTIKRDPVTVMRTVAIPPPAEPTPAVPAPVVMAKPVVAAAAPPAMAAPEPRVYSPAPQVQPQAPAHHAEKPMRKVPASGLVRGYYVNAGLFAVASNGNKAYRKMEKAGLPVFSDTVSSAKGQLTRVRVGPYPTRAKADAAAKKIRALKLDAKVFKH